MLAHVLQCCESIEYVMAVVQGHAYARYVAIYCETSHNTYVITGILRIVDLVQPI